MIRLLSYRPECLLHITKIGTVAADVKSKRINFKDSVKIREKLKGKSREKLR